jgi:hypothetical protein
VAGSCESVDEPSGHGATELVNIFATTINEHDGQYCGQC